MFTVKLVPPSLKIVAMLLINKIELHQYMPYLFDSIKSHRTLTELVKGGYAPIQLAYADLPSGLSACLTNTESGALVWLQETSCHPWCNVLGRECQGWNDSATWLRKIHEKHESVFDKLPTA